MRNTNLLKNDKYIMLSVYADNMSNKERQLMLRSFFTDIDVFSAKGSAKIGLLRKFNNKKWVCKFRRKFRSVLYLKIKYF